MYIVQTENEILQYRNRHIYNIYGRNKMSNNIGINSTNVVMDSSSSKSSTMNNVKKMTKKEIRKHLLQQSMNSKENKRYLKHISQEFKIPEIAKRNTTKSFYNVHETSALDFDALPKKGKTRMTKRKLRRAKKVKAKHKQQEDEYIQMMKNMEKQQQAANIIHAVREVIVPDMTSFEKYEILAMSLMATYISGKEMRLGYWMKKVAFCFWAILLFVASRVSHGSDNYWPIHGSSLKYEKVYNFMVSFIWLMIVYLRFPIDNFVIKTSIGVFVFCLSYILHVRGTLKGIIPELVQRRLKIT